MDDDWGYPHDLGNLHVSVVMVGHPSRGPFFVVRLAETARGRDAELQSLHGLGGRLLSDDGWKVAGLTNNIRDSVGFVFLIFFGFKWMSWEYNEIYIYIYCYILYYIILCYIILYYIILYCIIL